MNGAKRKLKKRIDGNPSHYFNDGNWPRTGATCRRLVPGSWLVIGQISQSRAGNPYCLRTMCTPFAPLTLLSPTLYGNKWKNVAATVAVAPPVRWH